MHRTMELNGTMDESQLNISYNFNKCSASWTSLVAARLGVRHNALQVQQHILSIMNCHHRARDPKARLLPCRPTREVTACAWPPRGGNGQRRFNVRELWSNALDYPGFPQRMIQRLSCFSSGSLFTFLARCLPPIFLVCVYVCV